MGWGITRGRPPDKKQKEEEEKRSRDKLVKTIKWKEQKEEQTLGTEPLLFNGDGKFGRRSGWRRGRDEQAEAGGVMDSGPGEGPRLEHDRGQRQQGAGRGGKLSALDPGPDKGPPVSVSDKGHRSGPDKGP